MLFFLNKLTLRLRCKVQQIRVNFLEDILVEAALKRSWELRELWFVQLCRLWWFHSNLKNILKKQELHRKIFIYFNISMPVILLEVLISSITFICYFGLGKGEIFLLIWAQILNVDLALSVLSLCLIRSCRRNDICN